MDGARARAMVPSGASTGAHEALELRDNDSTRFFAKGVLRAVQNVQGPIATALKGLEAQDWVQVDQRLLELDTSAKKEHLGANAMLAVSLAVARALATSCGEDFWRFMRVGDARPQMPRPLFNLINGGAHVGAKGAGLEVQEFMLAPRLGEGAGFKEHLRAGCEVFFQLKKLLSEAGLSVTVGDEGGVAPRLSRNIKALEHLAKAVERTPYKLGENIFFALDVAATEFFNPQRQVYDFEGKALCAEALLEVYKGWRGRFPLVSIEDAFAEDDWAAWQRAMGVLGESCALVGDDLFVTQVERLRKGVRLKAANALLVKPNQVGSLYETLEAIQVARGAGFGCVMSHRSGETEDTSIAHLAVAWSCERVKMGAPCRGERTAKYNELVRIEERL